MPEDYRIDAGQRVVRCRAWGDFTGQELVAHYERMMADQAFDRTFDQIGDLREVTSFSMSSETIERVAKMEVFAPATRRALIAPSAVHFGLARMFSAYAEDMGQDVQVVHSLAAAEQCLGLPPGAPS